MMKLVKLLKPKFSVIGLILLIYVFNLMVRSPFPPYNEDKRDKNFIHSDGIGYYSYLPATFIYHDLSFSFFNDVYKKNYDVDPPSWITSFIVKTDTGTVDKYWIGESLLLLPFFLLAHLLSLLFNFQADGYSILYQYAVFSASLFYLLLGCRFISNFLLSHGFSKKITSIAIATIVLGTNLFYYTMYEPAMSHVYSFFCISGFFYFGSKFFKEHSFKDFALLSLFAILLFLVRPVNIIVVVFLPFIAGNWNSFTQAIKQIFGFKLKLFIPIFFLTLIVLQMSIWHHQCNKWVVWSYPGEEFFFANPHYFDILFSYRKGFFVYMPICFVALTGLIYLFINRKPWFFSVTLGFAFIIYILSSWYAWDYSACMGNRAFIDYYFIFAVLIAASYKLLKSTLSFWILTSVYFILILFNHIQIYQYRHSIYHNSEMDKIGYWQVFLQTGKGYEGLLYDWSDKADIERLNKTNKIIFFSSSTNFDTVSPLWSNNHVEEQSFALSGKNVSMVNDKINYGDGFHLPETNITTKERVVVESTLNAYLYNTLSNAYIVHQITNNGKTIYWKSFKIFFRNSPIGKWKKHSYISELPTLNAGDELVVFILNSGNSSFYVDDFSVYLGSYK